MRFLAPALAVLLAASAAAQSRPPRPHTRAAPPAQAAAPDPELEKAIRARFAASKISTNGFTVHVQGGVATLEGKTDILQHKGVATRLAKAAGAVKVLNRIQVSQAARDRASANLAKGRRRAQVKRGQPRDGRK